MVDADAHPAFVAVQIVDAVRNGLAARRGLDQEVMDAHPLGRLRRAPRTADVLEVPHQFLFLGIHRDRRLLPSLRVTHAPRDVAKLRIPIHVLTAFTRLDVALQAIAEAVQQFGNNRVADVVAQAVERHGQRARTQAGPAQRRLGIAGGRRLHQRVQVAEQRGVTLGGALPAAARLARACADHRFARRQLTQAALNRRRRDPRRTRNLRDATVADRLRFRRRPQAARSLRQHW